MRDTIDEIRLPTGKINSLDGECQVHHDARNDKAEKDQLRTVFQKQKGKSVFTSSNFIVAIVPLLIRSAEFFFPQNVTLTAAIKVFIEFVLLFFN